MAINLISLDEWRNPDATVRVVDNMNQDALEDLMLPPTEEVNMESSMTYSRSIDYTEAEWKEVKGIGPTLAKRLCENGPYDHMDSIKDVKGIKPKIFDSILEWHSEKIS